MMFRWLKGFFVSKQTRGAKSRDDAMKTVTETETATNDLGDHRRTELIRALSQPHTLAERQKAIAAAMKAGMSFREIEQVLDWLDQ